ncbi:GFA family protein [Vreelandella sp. 2A-K22]
MPRCITTTARASLNDPLEPVHDLLSSNVNVLKPHCPPHGALFYAAADYPKQAVIIAGEPHSYQGRYFCSACGSSFFSVSEEEIAIHLGPLDSPNQLKATYELWNIRREHWLPQFPNVEQYERDRQD